MLKPMTTGWIIGYFVAVVPIQYASNGSFIGGLMWSIFGIGVAIILEVFN